jgi:hypothetical protein
MQLTLLHPSRQQEKTEPVYRRDLPGKFMNHISFAVTILFVASMTAYSQSVERAPLLYHTATENNNYALAARAIGALRRLENHALVYRSLGEFEANNKLARVSFDTFRTDLQNVSAEIEAILAELPDGRVKFAISNSLSSYQDGAFWWAKTYQPRVVNVSMLGFLEGTRVPSDTAFMATAPYNAAINWRQASKYLKQAEKLIEIGQ